MMKINNTIKLFFLFDILVVLGCLFSSHFIWLINTQVAFVSSLLVTLGSYLGYKKNIESRVEDHINYDENYDEIDKLDDPYDLYSPEVDNTEVPENPTKEDIKKAMKPIKQNHMKNLKESFRGITSLYRVFGYVFLVIGFFYLKNNHYLEIYSYMAGFLIVPISSIIYGVGIKMKA